MLIEPSRIYHSPIYPKTIQSLPIELLQSILHSLPYETRVRSAFVCRRWYQIFKKTRDYEEGQVKGRLHLVAEIYVFYANNWLRNQIKQVLYDAQYYLMYPVSVNHLSILAKLQNIVNEYFNESTYCLDENYQQCLKKPDLSDLANFKLAHTQSKVDSGVYEALKPHVLRMIRKKKKGNVQFLTPLIYRIYLKCLSKTNPRHLILDCPFDLTNFDDMHFLSTLLPLFKKVTCVEFTNCGRITKPVCWSNNLQSIKRGLKLMPRLNKLVFSNLKELLTESDLRCIAEVAQRGLLKTIVFGKQSLSPRKSVFEIVRHLNIKSDPIKVVLVEENISYYWPPRT